MNGMGEGSHEDYLAVRGPDPAATAKPIAEAIAPAREWPARRPGPTVPMPPVRRREDRAP
jgi:hypothetical protein